MIPCGQCRFCRLEHSRQMAMRCMHEASLYPRNCFLTLTYDDEHLPPGGTLDYEAPVLFMKRFRERCGAGIRSYGCAEYGELLSRPHYHLCIFNYDFSDKTLFKKGQFPLYTSKLLSELWTDGHSSIGELTFESADYVARYVTKKMTGPLAQEHYGDRLPERSICVSRRPGIGREWAVQNPKLLREHDLVILRGKKMRPPKYYDKLFDLADPQAFAMVKAKRKEAGQDAAWRLQKEIASRNRRYGKLHPPHRLLVMAQVQDLKFQLLKRGYENGETDSV